MKSSKNAIKDICVLIAHMGPLLIIGIDGLNIVFKVIIALITFLYNALCLHHTSNTEQELSELKYKYKQDVKRYEEWQKKDSEYITLYQTKLDEAYIEIEKLRDEINTYKKAGDP